MSDKMREALERIAAYDVPDAHEMIQIARRALAEQPAQGEAVGEVTHRILPRGCHAECAGDMGVVYYPGDVLPVGTKLYTAPPAPAVPDGWKLVPARSTLEWVEAVAERGLKIGSVAGVIESVLAAAPEVKP